LDCGKGSPVAGCSSCTCPQWWGGTKCEQPYVIAQFVLNTKTQGSNVDLSVPSNQSAYIQWVQTSVLIPMKIGSYSSDVVVSDAQPQGDSVLVTVQFYGAQKLALRDNLITIVKSNKPFGISPLGATIQVSSAQAHDPPTSSPSNQAAYLASIIVPVIIGFILIAILIFCLVKKCGQGGGGGSGGGTGGGRSNQQDEGVGNIQSPSRIPASSTADIALDSRHDVQMDPIRDRGETSGVDDGLTTEGQGEGE